MQKFVALPFGNRSYDSNLEHGAEISLVCDFPAQNDLILSGLPTFRSSALYLKGLDSRCIVVVDLSAFCSG